MAIKNYTATSFWMDDAMFDQSRLSNANDRNRDDLLKMASVKRAIANFVRIVTGEDIKVKYCETKDISLTTGKLVILGAASVKERNFDAAVGLALHEGSHIKLSDFEVLKNLETLIPASLILEANAKYNNDPAEKFIDQENLVLKRVKNILNWIEDRRIDFFIYSTAPGYKSYYKAMYKKYFEAPIIDEALQSGSLRDETWGSYNFRLTNLTNPKRDLKALKGLPAIVRALDLNNISRLKNTREVLDVAIEVYKIIESNIPAPEIKPKEQPKKDEKDKNPKLIGYSAKGLPKGLKLNQRTGKLSGKGEPGEYKVIVTAHFTDKSKKRKRALIKI